MTRIDDQLDPEHQLESEDGEESADQGELRPTVLHGPRQIQRSSQPGGREEESDDADDRRGVPDIRPRDDAEHRHREGVGEREKRCCGPELPYHRRMTRGASLRNGHRHKEEADKGCRLPASAPTGIQELAGESRGR